nr:hypothetical protein [Candidatus Njordarchaeota archaeon]
MQLKLKRGVIPVLLLVSVLTLTYGVSSVSAADSSTWGVKLGDSAEWLVMASSNVTTMWYSETFSPVGNFSAPVGSTINLTVSIIVDATCRGNVAVGDLVLTNVSMAEISFNLLLGWYPFQPGLVCPVNWDVQKQNATSNGLTMKESTIGSTPVITFKYLPGDSTGTILTYDKATGLLVNGYGSFGKFMIEVSLISTSIDIGSVQSDYQTLGAGYVQIEVATMVGAIVVITVFILIIKRSAGEK